MTILKLYSKGDEVRELQRLLSLYPDGVFGPLTLEAVQEFQRQNNLEVDGIVGPATMKKLQEQYSEKNSLEGILRGTLKKSRRNINEIIIHCTATPEGKDYTTDDIKKWHKQKGWADIGYHYVIYRDGSINLGRDVNISGAHCTNHNSNSIGVCYVGGLAKNGKDAKDTRTPEQKDSLLKLLKELRKLYPKASIHSHRDYSNKDCPSFDATSEYKHI